MSNLRKAVFEAVEVAKAGCLPKLSMTVDLDIDEVLIARCKLGKLTEHPSHAALIRLVYQKAREVLNGCVFAAARACAAVPNFLFESVAEGGGAESFANLAHEEDSRGGDRDGVAVAGGQSVDEFFQARTSMPLPQGNAAIKEAA